MPDPVGDQNSRLPNGESDAHLIPSTALALGVLADLLFRPDGPLTFGGFVFAAAGLCALLLLDRGHSRRVRTASLSLLIVALVCMAGMVWRDAESLRALNFLGAVIAAALAGFRPTLDWLRARGVGEYLGGGISSAVSTGFGPLPTLVSWGRRDEGRGPSGARSRERLVAAMRGAILAIPILLGFGALFMAADPVFARIVTDVIQVDLEILAEHAILMGVFAWLSAGYLRTVRAGAPWEGLPIPVPRPRIGVMEVAIALGLLNALFLSFLAVQAGAILGGAEFVETTPGLTYAEYARQGFFALLAVTGFVIPVLLVADWAFEPSDPRDRWVFRSLALLLVGLVGLVVVVAFRRLTLYVDAFGLTEDRLLAAIVMGWLALVLIGLTSTVLRGRPRDFALGTFVSGFAVLALLNLINPQGTVVRANLAGAAEGASFDAEYASTLSADAVPALLRGLPDLDAEERCIVSESLTERFEGTPEGDWRSWRWSDRRARRLIEDGLANVEGC